MKKFLAIAFCVMASAASGLFANGGGDAASVAAPSSTAANVNAPGVFPIAKTPITVNVALRQSNNVEDYTTNHYTKMLEEKGNLKLTFEIFPAGNPGMEKLLVMVASGGVLPEALIGFDFSEEQIYSFGSEGVVRDLSGYYENWAYYFPEQIKKVKSLSDPWRMLHSPDGKVYYIPYILEEIGENYSLRGWMNKKWLDNLGLAMPATTSEFTAVLEAFATKDPTGTGRKDLVPAAGNTDLRGRLHDFLINAFIYNDQRDRLIVTNGKVDVIYNKPEYRDGLRYISDLVNRGLVLNQLFSINGQGLRGLIESDSSSATVGFFTAGLAGAISPTNQLRLEYVPMAPLKGPKGAQFTPYLPLLPNKRFVITKDAKNPEAIFRMGDLMCSEEASIWNRFGRPEIDWRIPREGEKSMYDSIGMPARLSQILPWGSIQNSHWTQAGAGIMYMGLMDGQVLPDNPLNNAIWVSASVPLYMDKAPPAANRVDFTMLTFDEMEAMKDLKNTINTYVNENLALFCTGQKSIERDWDAYVNELNRMGLGRYIELTQSGYDRAMGKK